MTFSCWEGLASAGAIEADRAVPHDLLEGGGLLEARLLQPQLVIGMDGAACPRRAIEGLWRQWQQRALLLGLEDEPGDLAGGAMTRVPAVPDTRPSRAPACRRGRASAPAEEVLADVGDSALPLSVSRWRGTAESTTKPRTARTRGRRARSWAHSDRRSPHRREPLPGLDAGRQVAESFGGILPRIRPSRDVSSVQGSLHLSQVAGLRTITISLEIHVTSNNYESRT